MVRDLTQTLNVVTCSTYFRDGITLWERSIPPSFICSLIINWPQSLLLWFSLTYFSSHLWSLSHPCYSVYTLQKYKKMWPPISCITKRLHTLILWKTVICTKIIKWLSQKMGFVSVVVLVLSFYREEKDLGQKNFKGVDIFTLIIIMYRVLVSLLG